MGEGGGGLLNEMQRIIATTRYGVVTSLVTFFSFQRTNRVLQGFFFFFVVSGSRRELQNPTWLHDACFLQLRQVDRGQCKATMDKTARANASSRSWKSPC